MFLNSLKFVIVTAKNPLYGCRYVKSSSVAYSKLKYFYSKLLFIFKPSYWVNNSGFVQQFYIYLIICSYSIILYPFTNFALIQCFIIMEYFLANFVELWHFSSQLWTN